MGVVSNLDAMVQARRVRAACLGTARRLVSPVGQSGQCRVGALVRAVRLAARYVPRATCLVQALATQILLGWHGHRGQLHIGVALDAKQGFRAHAWVESGWEVLVGGAEALDEYAPMLVLDGSARQ